MLKLTREERAWLNDYRKAFEGKHPGVVHEWTSSRRKRSGCATGDHEQVRESQKKLRRIGYLLASTSNVLPSILAYTQEEWESRRRNRSTFRQAVERDAVRVV